MIRHRQPNPHRLRRGTNATPGPSSAALLLAAPLLGLACSSDSTLPAADLELGARATEVACATGDERPCGVTLDEDGDRLSCYEGLQRCTDGEWGACVDGAVVERTRPRLEVAARLLPRASWENLPCFPQSASGAGGAGGAAGSGVATGVYEFYNACDPNCRVFDQTPLEEPFGSDPRLDFSVLPDPETLTTRFPGVSVTSPCTDGLDCQFNQRCEEPVTALACAHSKCVVSDAPSAACAAADTCVQAICVADPTCCDEGVEGAWDADCVSRVKTVCDAFCADVPPWHDLCETGDALTSGYHWCVDAVCALRPSCCDPTYGWDSNCRELVVSAAGCDSYVSVPVGPTPNPDLCGYALYSEGDLRFGQGGLVKGLIGTAGDLVIESGGRIEGDLEVRGTLEFRGSTTTPPNLLGDAVVYNADNATWGTTLINGSTIEGNLQTRGGLQLDNSSGTGQALVEEGVQLLNLATWWSSATATAASPGIAFEAGGTVTWNKEVRGDVYSPAAPTPLPGSTAWPIGTWQDAAPPADLVVPEPPSYDVTIDPPMPCTGTGSYVPELGDVTINSGWYPASGILPPGCYGRLAMNGGTLALGPGVYAFTELGVNTTAQIRFEDVGPLPVSIYVSGAVVMGPETLTVPRFRFAYPPASLKNADEVDFSLVNWFFAAGSATTINIDQVTWVGRIVAPSANVIVTSQPTTRFNGTVHTGGTLRFEPSAHLIDPATYSDNACAGVIVKECAIDSTPEPPESGVCESWRDGALDGACLAFDLALDVPCSFGDRPQIAVCNHGIARSPATGVTIAFYEHDVASAAAFGSPDPAAAGLAPAGTCAVTEEILPGTCSLVDCDPVAGEDELLVMVNPDGTASTGYGTECSLRDNWTLYSGAPGVMECAYDTWAPDPAENILYTECGDGGSPQWMFLTWDADLAPGATIDFAVEAGTRDPSGAVAFWSAPIIYTAQEGTTQPGSCTVFDATTAGLACPVVLGNDFPARSGDALRVTVTLNGGVGLATLHEWNVTHSCYDDE